MPCSRSRIACARKSSSSRRRSGRAGPAPKQVARARTRARSAERCGRARPRQPRWRSTERARGLWSASSSCRQTPQQLAATAGRRPALSAVSAAHRDALHGRRRAARELWVRVYPDDIAVHTHEKALTRDEADAGVEYWTTRAVAAADRRTQTSGSGSKKARGARWPTPTAARGRRGSPPRSSGARWPETENQDSRFF